jgi:hypothetical protein
MQTRIQSGIADVLTTYPNEMALVSDPTSLLNRLNLLLAAGQISSTNLAIINTAISSISTSTSAAQYNRIHAAILLVMAAPQYIVQK